MFKKSAAVVISVVLAVSLSGCTPPMPPEIRAALAEQEYTCVEGTSVISVPTSTTDMAPGWQTSVSDACPGMTFDAVYDSPKGSDLVFTNLGLDQELCPASIEVPFAVDAAVLVYRLDSGNSFNFTPELISKIFSGEITDWSDPLISEVNLGSIYDSEKIIIKGSAFNPALESFSAWMKRLLPTYSSSIKAQDAAVSAKDFKLAEGEIAIIPNSIAQELALMPAGVITGKDYAVDVINPDFGSISSAATQLEFESTGNTVKTFHNSKLKPLPAPGQEVASAPYQAVYTAPLYICGDASLPKRAAARFILRQDQQGAVGATFFVPIPEAIRVGALDIISEGLTLPQIDSENMPANQ
jgi:hypothetical protein